MAARRYTEEHEWITVDGDVGTVGISDYAQEQLGDIVYIELPEAGRKLAQGDEAAVIESVKAASELYAPVDGEVVEVNRRLADEPGLVNADATGDGWFVKLRITDASQLDGLMDDAGYQEFVSNLE
ncbi:MAG TPA: glycine cleavage system protein GcvH [Alphaproteobacteria bacterium]